MFPSTLLQEQLKNAAKAERERRQAQAERVLAFRGGNAEIQAYLHPPRPQEWMLEGPSETGKTMASLNFVHALARLYPQARGAFVRKRRVDMSSTVLDIYRREFLDFATDVTLFGGENVEFYEYKNGTRIWVAGIDNPGKVLSGAFDFVYVNQAEELNIQDWEYLATRTTGRAGVIVPGILFGDMNPAPLSHWVYARERIGKIKFFSTTHKDNPRLFDDKGEPTEQGKSTLASLSSLTGIRRIRLFEGKRANVEGLVYGEVWDEQGGSVTEDAEYEAEAGMVAWGCDDGYSAGSYPNSGGRVPETGFYAADAHPRVILFAQLKPDGHLDVFDENVACLKLSDAQIAECLCKPYDDAKVIALLGSDPKSPDPVRRAFEVRRKLHYEGKQSPFYATPEFAAHGPGAAEFRGRLFAANVLPRQITQQVETSIQEVRSWLQADKNGWRKIRVHPRCHNLRMEMASYALDPASGKPIKAFDHGADALRYLVWALRGLRQ